MPPDERLEREQTHRTNEAIAHSNATLGTETVHLLLFLSENGYRIFAEGLMLQQLAELLNYFLDLLVGKKSSQLLVSDQEKYGFRPKELLSVLVQIYVNFHNHFPNSFAEQVLADGRSYRPETFAAALKNLGTNAAAAAFAKFINDLKTTTAAEEPIDESGAPEEFFDELMGILMKDPVRLPSGQILDRSTMTRHFLANGNKNPYTNQPLNPEDLVPLDDLRARIEAWREEKKQAKK